MPKIQFDPTVSIEGIATAVGVIIGVLGAVLGFLIDLIRRARAKAKDQRERADRRTIMEILEKNLIQGLTKAQIKDAFEAQESASFRKRAGANKPSDLTDDDFAKYLRDLQWNHMIDQLDANTYRLRTRILDLYESREANRQALRTRVLELVQERKILDIIQRNYDQLDRYQKSETIEILSQLGTPDAVKRIITELDSTDPSVAFAAAKELARLIAR